jgi:DNA ligase-1
MSTINALEALESSAGSNAKKGILREEVNNALLQQVFQAALDPYVNYGVAKFKMPPALDASEIQVTQDEILALFIEDVLPRLEARDLSGKAAVKAVENFMAGGTEVVQKWAKRILIKNLRCGVQAGTLDDIWPGLIRSFNVQLASSLNVIANAKNDGIIIKDDIVYPVMVDPKLDGLRCLTVKENGTVTMYTRNGRIIETLPTIQKALEAAPFDNMVIDAEAMGADWNESSSVVGSTKSKKDDSNMVLSVFDAMTLAEWQARKTEMTFSGRTQLVDELVAKVNAKCVQKIPCKVVFTEDELISFYKECLDNEFEGIMIKNLHGLYNFDGKRDETVVKMKPETTYEGTIVGWYFGRDGTKNAGSFGGFNILLPNGVVTNCGGGLVAQKVEQAEIMSAGPGHYIGRIVEVEGQPPLTKDGKIRFPRIKRYRNASDVDPKVTAAYNVWVESNLKVTR